MKRILCFLLAALMIVSFAGCKKEEAKKEIASLDFEIGDTGGLEVPFGNGETIEIVALDETNATSTYIYEKLGQVTGLDIKVTRYPSASLTEKTQVIIASGNLPDIFGTGVGSVIETNNYAMQGAFAAVNDYDDKMPNFKKFFGEGAKHNWIYKSLAANDGKIYILPTYEMQRDVNHGMLYRKDVFDKLSLEMWNSPDEFYEVLKALKAEYPDSYPLTSKTGKTLLANYAISWGIKAYEPYFDESSKSWKYSDTDPRMKNMLDYLNKLYTEGLLDPEFLTNTAASWTTKMTTGKSFVTFDWIGRLDMFDAQSEIEGYDLRYGNPVGPEQTTITLAKVATYGATVTKNKNSELSMKLLDFFYSDAGAELMTCGVRGEVFEIGEDGKARYLEFPEDKKVEITDLAEKYGMWVGGMYTRVDKRSCYFNFTKKEQEAQEWPLSHGGFEPEDPVVTFVGDDVQRVADLQSELATAFEEVMFKYIIGQETGDAAWDSWIEKAEKKGVNELVEIYNRRHNELGL